MRQTGRPGGKLGTIIQAEVNLDVDLSDGEWQKIALARMFMREADLLILEEPTAALDVQAEYDVYNRFVELMSGKTSKSLPFT